LIFWISPDVAIALHASSQDVAKPLQSATARRGIRIAEATRAAHRARRYIFAILFGFFGRRSELGQPSKERLIKSQKQRRQLALKDSIGKGGGLCDSALDEPSP
jgi:hypothetical protein